MAFLSGNLAIKIDRFEVQVAAAPTPFKTSIWCVFVRAFVGGGIPSSFVGEKELVCLLIQRYFPQQWLQSQHNNQRKNVTRIISKISLNWEKSKHLLDNISECLTVVRAKNCGRRIFFICISKCRMKSRT